MKYLIAFLLAASLNRAVAGALPEVEVNKIVNSIFRIEGGSKAPYPYGIRSIKTSNPRRVCENTVRNNFGRWKAAGSKGDFLQFLAERYCPTSGFNLSNAEKKCNKYWLPNLKKDLGVNSYEELRKKMQN